MSAEPEPDSHEQPSLDEVWRREVASRLNNYRARRRRKDEGDASMRLDFNPPEEAAPLTTKTGAADTDFYRRANAAFEESFDVPLAHASVPPPSATASRDAADWLYTGYPTDVPSEAVAPADALAEENSGYDPDFDFERPRTIGPTADSSSAGSNVIIFPRPVPAPASIYELAEPMIDRPRILDVPEEPMPSIQGPLFADIRLEGHENSEPAPVPEIELPLQVAQFPVRAFASLIDGLFVVVATAIFGAIVWQMIPNLPHTKPIVAAAAVIPTFFWCVYQYLFLVYAGATAGMQMAGVRLSTFEGKFPTWTERRSRAFSLTLSCMSAGLGFAWAAVDQDLLCWHDRISRTYVTQAR